MGPSNCGAAIVISVEQFITSERNLFRHNGTAFFFTFGGSQTKTAIFAYIASLSAHHFVICSENVLYDIGVFCTVKLILENFTAVVQGSIFIVLAVYTEHHMSLFALSSRFYGALRCQPSGPHYACNSLTCNRVPFSVLKLMFTRFYGLLAAQIYDDVSFLYMVG
jgi:hypothetical protein